MIEKCTLPFQPDTVGNSWPSWRWRRLRPRGGRRQATRSCPGGRRSNDYIALLLTCCHSSASMVSCIHLLIVGSRKAKQMLATTRAPVFVARMSNMCWLQLWWLLLIMGKSCWLRCWCCCYLHSKRCVGRWEVSRWAWPAIWSWASQAPLQHQQHGHHHHQDNDQHQDLRLLLPVLLLLVLHRPHDQDKQEPVDKTNLNSYGLYWDCMLVIRMRMNWKRFGKVWRENYNN